jgi:predicted RNA methylase
MSSLAIIPMSLSCLDLGSGTGMLSIGAAFLCDVVIGVDCDMDAIEVARENACSVDLEDTINFILAKVMIRSNEKAAGPRRGSGVKKRGGRSGRGGRGGRGSQSSSQTKSLLIEGAGDGIPLKNKCVDTVLTNPPFGTKMNAGIDAQFLRTATRLARHAVYSFHKRSTRAFLTKLVQEWGFTVEVAAEMVFDIPQMYNFHKQKNKDIEVDLLRIIIRSNEEEEEAESNSEDKNASN